MHPTLVVPRRIAFVATLAILTTLCPSGGAQASGRLSIELPPDALEVVEDARGGPLRTGIRGSAVLREAGRPELPYAAPLFVLPPGTRLAGATVVPGGWEELELLRPVPVHEGLVSDEGKRVDGDGIAQLLEAQPAAARSAAAAWPPVAGVATGTHRMHGYALGSVLVFPVRQRADGTLERMTSARVELELEPAAFAELPVTRRVDWPGSYEEDQDQVRSIVANPADVAARAPVRGVDPAMAQARPLPGRDEGPAPSRVPALPQGRVDYIILTTQALAASFQPLADAHTREGLRTAILTVEDVQANHRIGGDLQETVRMMLRTAYEEWGTRYVLIGGDADVLPPRYARSRFYPPGGYTDIPADLYFAGVDGNWNKDADGIFGEGYVDFTNIGDNVDMLAEFALGRAPVKDSGQATVFVQKCLDYMSPADPDAYGRGLFASEVLFPQEWSEPTSPTLDGATYSERLIADYIVAGGNFMQAWRLYENFDDYFGAIPESKQAVLDSLDTGRFGLANHVGHGFYYNMSLGDANAFVSDADALQNGPNWFLLYALNCSSGAFDFECLLERFIQNPNGGSVISMGSARAAFPTTADQYQQEFYREVFVDKNVRVGVAMMEGRAVYAGSTLVEGSDRWTHFTYTLLGDPALRVWREAPTPMALSGPATVPLGTASYVAHVEDGGSNPVPGVEVALSSGDGRVVTGTTDGNGDATLDLGPFSGEVQGLTLVASGANRLPATQAVTVAGSATAHLAADEGVVDDSATAPADGDGDGHADSGESVQWMFQFTNGGDGSTATNAWASLAPLDTLDLAVTTDSLWIGDVAFGATAVPAEGFVLQLGTQLTDGSRPRFALTVHSDQGSWVQERELPLRAPEPEVTRVWWDDSSTGNGDGTIQAGELLELHVELKNFGSADLVGATATLSSNDPDLVISQATTSWPALGLLGAAGASTPLQLTENTTGAENWMLLTIDSPQGHSWEHYIELRGPALPQSFALDTSQGPNSIVAKVGEESPMQAHLHGYRFYRSSTDSGPFELVSADTIERSGWFRDDGLASLTRYWYQVSAVDSSGIEGPRTGALSASTAPPEFATGFPLPVGREVAGASAVGDMLGDGSRVATFGSEYLYAVGPDGQELLDGDNNSQTLGPLGGPAAPNDRFTPSGVTMADLDSDGAMELIGSNWITNEVWALNADGTSVPGWPRQMSARSWATPVVADLDDDGDLEVIVNNVGARTYVWHHDGTDFFDGDNNAGSVGIFHYRPGENFNRSTPLVLDVDGDGTLEIVFGTHIRNGGDNFVYALKNDATNAPGWPKNLGPQGFSVGAMSAADLDANGSMEILFPCDNDSLYVWETDGSNFSNFPIPFLSEAGKKDSVTPCPAPADFDGDGLLEIVAVSIIDKDQCELTILDRNGDHWPGFPRTLPGLSECSPLVADLDGDASLDILFGIGGGSDSDPNVLYAIASDGSDVAGFPITLAGAVRATPSIDDFDQDGDIDIVYAGFDRQLHAWDMPFPYRSWLAPWPTFHGDLQRTGVYNAARATAARGGVVELAFFSGGVRVTTTFDGALPADLRLKVERSAAGGAWELVADGLRADGSRLELTDAEAPAGVELRYRVSGGGLVVESATERAPARQVQLLGNFPNPFNPATSIRFEIPGTAGSQVPTRLELFDLAGRLVRTLVAEPLAPGVHTVEWDGKDASGGSVASGSYFARLSAAGQQRGLKMTLLK